MSTTTLAPAPTDTLRFTHRPGLDGLRAVAALLVVLFHAGMPGVRNGYVGVDVFFILSGFLITSLLVRERLKNGRVSLLAFYARRARRLFPAALSVLLITAFAYSIIASPLSVAENRMGFVFAAVYVSNWYFLAKSQDYFAAEDSASPVLHYWSLSVEEQFYLVWPLVLLTLLAVPAVRRRAGAWVLFLLAGASLAYSAWASSQEEMLWYFGTLARAYQLLLGATLAMIVLRWNSRTDQVRGTGRPTRWGGAVLAVAGLAGLFYAGSDYGPVESWWVGLAGAAATLTVILGLEFSRVGPASWLLSTPVARALGRWSYSIYLWHWPIIVLGEEAGVLPPEWPIRVPVVTSLAIALAALWWVILEGPISKIPLRRTGAQAAAVSLGILGTVGSAAGAWWILQVPPTADLVVEQQEREIVELTQPEAVVRSNGLNAETYVINGARADAPTVLVVGDSHALLWRTALTDVAEREGWRFVMVHATTCPWMDIKTTLFDGSRTPGCGERFREPAAKAIKRFQPDVTIFLNRSALPKLLVTDDGRSYKPGDRGWIPNLKAGANAFLDRVEGDAGIMVFIETWPQTTTAMDECVSTGANPETCTQAAVEPPGMAEQERMLRTLAAERGGVSVSLDELACPDGVCPAMVGNVLTYRDNHHLSDSYAEMLLPKVIDLMGPEVATRLR